MNLGQDHDTPLGHGQSLCEMRTYQVYPEERYGTDTNYEIFLPVTLNFLK